MVQIVRPEDSMAALEEMTGHAEKVLQLLGLPYRKIILCTGDMGFGACKTYDLKYGSRHRTPTVRSFLLQRLGFPGTSYAGTLSQQVGQENPLFFTTRTVSGLAVGRTLVAVMENDQQADGRIEVPEVLRPYMNGLEYIG